MNQYHQNYGYDLKASLAKHPIKELENPGYKEDLINSLKKGNIQSVTFVNNGVENKQFVEANPHFKTARCKESTIVKVMIKKRVNQKIKVLLKIQSKNKKLI